MRYASCLCLMFSAAAFAAADAEPALVFDVVDVGAPAADVPVIEPWRSVALDAEYGGRWVVAGELDGDGEVELVSAQNFNADDVHYTSTAVAQKLDGSVLWRWGDPELGRKALHHDVAVQVHDWDGDGRNEVVLLADEYLVELHGATGAEKRRLVIPKAASDCLVFCDLSGVGRPTDFLVTTRYTDLWAYDKDGGALWHVRLPGGYRTAHQARPLDVDGDDRDEIMAGYALLNRDGKVVWTFKTEQIDQKRGHLDCARVLHQGASAQSTRIAGTCCGANGLVLIDGAGKTLWEVPGAHYESIQVGRILPGLEQPQILVDIDHRPRGESDLCIFDAEGNLRGKVRGDYCRHHGLVDWDGDGLSEFVVGYSGAMYNHEGRRIATFAIPNEAEPGSSSKSLIFGDMNGDGVPDVTRSVPGSVHIYKNPCGVKPGRPVPFGTPLNYTFY